MTEQEFERRIETAADQFERRVEAAADRLDAGITKKWNTSRLFRCTVKTVSFSAEAGLILGGVRLASSGHRTAGAWCIGLGVVGMAADLIWWK